MRIKLFESYSSNKPYDFIDYEEWVNRTNGESYLLK